VPRNIEHSLVWTKLPIVHPAVVDSRIAARVHQDGLWGFTANVTPPPPASRITECLPVLAEWGVTEDMIIQSPPPTEEEAQLLTRACAEVDRFVRNNWDESIWETAWIVNPPVRRSTINRLSQIANLHYREYRAYQSCLTFTCLREGRYRPSHGGVTATRITRLVLPHAYV
jgi:hypothetical protein